MCDFETSCIYYQDYVKKVRKNKMARARKEINKLKLEIDKYSYAGIAIFNTEFQQNVKKELTSALKKKEEEYKKEFGKRLKLKKAQYPLLTLKECDYCTYRQDYAKCEHRKSKQNSNFDKIVIAEDNYRNAKIFNLPFLQKKYVLQEISEYHEKLLMDKYKKK